MSKLSSQIKCTKVADFIGHKDAIYDMTLGNEENFYTVGADGWLVHWNINQPKSGNLLIKNSQPFYSVQYNKSTQNIWAGDATGKIFVTDLKNQLLAELSTGNRAIFGFTPIQNTDIMWAYSGNGQLIRFDNLHQTSVVPISKKSIRTAVAWGNQHLLLGCSDHQIYIFNWKNEKVEDTISIHQNSVFDLDGEIATQTIYSAGRDAKLCKFNLQQFAIEKEVNAHLYQITSLDINPELSFLLTASMDKEIKLWSTENLELLKVINLKSTEGHKNCINRVLWINANEFISCSDDRSAKHFKFEFNL